MPRLVPSRPLAVAAAVVVALALAACGQDEDVTQARFQADLQERTEVPEEVAACLTERIFEAYDQDEVNRIYRAATEDEIGGDRLDELTEINEECTAAESGEEADDEGSGPTTTDAGTGDGGDETTTTGG